MSYCAESNCNILSVEDVKSFFSGKANIWMAVPENEVTDVISPQTPLLVANFPKPVKIDKNSDLTIIIRYDT